MCASLASLLTGCPSKVVVEGTVTDANGAAVKGMSGTVSCGSFGPTLSTDAPTDNDGRFTASSDFIRYRPEEIAGCKNPVFQPHPGPHAFNGTLGKVEENASRWTLAHGRETYVRAEMSFTASNPNMETVTPPQSYLGERKSPAERGHAPASVSLPAEEGPASGDAR